MKLYYLAHAVAPNKYNTYEENIEDGRNWWTFLLRRGVQIAAPWYGLCSALDDSDPTDREIGMTVDKSVLERCDGMILTGVTVSTGMKAELDLCMDRGGEIINLIGMSFDEANKVLSMLNM